jgi:hypothetical protein
MKRLDLRMVGNNTLFRRSESSSKAKKPAAESCQGHKRKKKSSDACDSFATTVDGVDGERPCVAFDDFVRTIFHPLEGVPPADVHWDECQHCELRLLSFLAMGKQMVGVDVAEESTKKETDKYSDVRDEVFQFSKDVHRAPLAKMKKSSAILTKSPAKQTFIGTGVSALSSSPGVAQSSHDDDSESPSMAKLQELMQEPGWLFQLVEFMNDAKLTETDTKYQPFCVKLLSGVVHRLTHQRQSTSIQELFDVAACGFSSLIPETWAHFSSIVLQNVRKTEIFTEEVQNERVGHTHTHVNKQM